MFFFFLSYNGLFNSHAGLFSKKNSALATGKLTVWLWARWDEHSRDLPGWTQESLCVLACVCCVVLLVSCVFYEFVCPVLIDWDGVALEKPSLSHKANWHIYSLSFVVIFQSIRKTKLSRCFVIIIFFHFIIWYCALFLSIVAEYYGSAPARVYWKGTHNRAVFKRVFRVHSVSLYFVVIFTL